MQVWNNRFELVCQKVQVPSWYLDNVNLIICYQAYKSTEARTWVAADNTHTMQYSTYIVPALYQHWTVYRPFAGPGHMTNSPKM